MRIGTYDVTRIETARGEARALSTKSFMVPKPSCSRFFRTLDPGIEEHIIHVAASRRPFSLR